MTVVTRHLTDCCFARIGSDGLIRMHLTLFVCVLSALTLCHLLHLSACYRITQVVMTSTVLPDDATSMCDVLFDAKHRTGRTAVRVPEFPTLEELGPFWVSLDFIPVNLFAVLCVT
jgi:hypothetical protein